MYSANSKISVTDHFRAWSRMGMKLGNLYEVALNVEGYQSSGSHMFIRIPLR